MSHAKSSIHMFPIAPVGAVDERKGAQIFWSPNHKQ